MKAILGAALLVGIFAGCSHHHAHHEHVYYHPHRLACGHDVWCRYDRGRHFYRPHFTHESYWHAHHVGGGRYVECFVTRRHHRHR